MAHNSVTLVRRGYLQDLLACPRFGGRPRRWLRGWLSVVYVVSLVCLDSAEFANVLPDGPLWPLHKLGDLVQSSPVRPTPTVEPHGSLTI